MARYPGAFQNILIDSVHLGGLGSVRICAMTALLTALGRILFNFLFGNLYKIIFCYILNSEYSCLVFFSDIIRRFLKLVADLSSLRIDESSQQPG